jgi:hypothetical protein
MFRIVPLALLKIIILCKNPEMNSGLILEMLLAFFMKKIPSFFLDDFNLAPKMRAVKAPNSIWGDDE